MTELKQILECYEKSGLTVINVKVVLALLNLFEDEDEAEITTTLANGQTVREGDKVYFINSDGVRCDGVIERRLSDCTHVNTKEKLKKGTLFFWNKSFKPSDYKGLAISF